MISLYEAITGYACFPVGELGLQLDEVTMDGADLHLVVEVLLRLGGCHGLVSVF